MKAVIMAGGEGTRLRPLSLGQPKPMTPLFDRPVMEHIIALLRRSGITDIAVTLQYLPGVVKDYFGDGGEQGVRLEYFVEREPLGTAGSVKNCILFRGVRVEKGAQVENCVLFKGTVVKKDATLRCVIADKAVTIREGRTLIGDESYPVVVARNATV